MRFISGTNTFDITVEMETKTFLICTETANTATADAPEIAPRATLGIFWFTISQTWFTKIHALNAATDRKSALSKRRTLKRMPSRPMA